MPNLTEIATVISPSAVISPQWQRIPINRSLKRSTPNIRLSNRHRLGRAMMRIILCWALEGPSLSLITRISLRRSSRRGISQLIRGSLVWILGIVLRILLRRIIRLMTARKGKDRRESTTHWQILTLFWGMTRVTLSLRMQRSTTPSPSMQHRLKVDTMAQTSV